MNGLLAISLALCQYFYPGTSNERYLLQKQCVVYYNTCIRQKLNNHSTDFVPQSEVDLSVTQCIMDKKE